MSSIHDCDLIEEDLLLWQMLDPMIMAVSFSLHWVVQMNLITSTRSLERSATQSSLSLSLLEACICFSVIKGSCGVVCVRYVWNHFTSFWAACILSASLGNVSMGCCHHYLLFTVFLLKRSVVLPFKSSLTRNMITALLV